MIEPIPVVLALGSNLGDRLTALRGAIEALSPYVEVQKKSRVYETPSAYVANQPAFLNAALLGATKLEPLALLWTLKNIESDMGRQPTFRYGSRVIDIDIIFYGDRVVDTPELTIPHLLMTERDFVLYPVNDIAPLWQHPKKKQTISELLALLPDSDIMCVDEAL